MPTTRSATAKQTKLEDFEPDNTSKTKQTAKKTQTASRNQEEATKTEQSSRKSTTKSIEGSNPPKPDSALERGKAKTERNTGAASRNSQAPKPNTSAKRKAPTEDFENDASQPSKKSRSTAKATKQAQLSNSSTTPLEKPIMINRSPVLQLWATCVSHFLHPDISWPTCLSIGGSIATLCAISKGRATGKVGPKNDSAIAEDKREKRKQNASKGSETREIEVMGFPQQIRGEAVVVDGKPKPLKEGLLMGKFGGEEEYERVKKVMEEGLQSWEDEKEELDNKAFHMYERFRPDVPKGGSGWGRKGELNLHKIKDTIEP